MQPQIFAADPLTCIGVTPSNLSVLVAEDHVFQRSVVVDYLLQHGVKEVLEAGDGIGAMSTMNSRPTPVDVLFCDLDMPGMDGVELIRHVAATSLAHSVVLLSGLDTILIDSVESMARAHGLNVLGTIEKPVTPQRISNVLARYRKPSGDSAAEPRAPATAQDVAEAVRLGQIRPHFQPKVSFASRAVVGVEVLARWHKRGETVLPAVFIDVAERNGLIDDLTWSIMAQSLEARKSWVHINAPLKVAINLSVSTLGRVGAADRIVALTNQANVPCADVILEVTESLVTSNLAYVLENLARLRMRGFGISIDDYGTGFSSMQQLSRVPFTELKIDQSFVNGATAKPNVRAILESSLQLAKKLGLASVAEGIEREEEWGLLRSLGCDVAQGYYISRPMPSVDFSNWYDSWNSQIS
jgi:EAL domain-containing protein (putative c-di-GMP-specific phosphodiesterase class I)/FixJ family two-component response regulator